jgi:hypothetical protein
MSFPLTPANNQVTLENGIAYTYNASRGAWYRTPATALTSLTSNTFTVLNSIIFSDGTSQTTAANPTDAYARTTANTATNNITILQGVNTTQNTNITNATTLAQASFDYANTILSLDSNIDTLARTTANTATNNITIIQGVDATQNTNITAADAKAQAAFDKANDAFTLANTANAAASSGGGESISGTFTSYIDKFTGNGSQTEFSLSTTPDNENQTMVFLNGVYQNKDTYSISGANVVFTDTATANDTIEVSTFARVLNVDSSMYKTRIYQGDGSTTTFTISSGHTANTILLFNNGVAQFPVDDYTVGGTILTYVLPPGSDETIQIRELPLNTLVPSTQALMRRYTANGVQTTFTVTSGQTANSMFVYENGICQVPINDYTVSGTILTFTTAPIANVVVQIRELSI